MLRNYPVEVIKEFPVEVFKDKIVDRVVELHEVTVKDRVVNVPIVQQTAVPLLQEKPIVTEKIVEQIVQIPNERTKEVPFIETVEKPIEVNLTVEKVVEIDRPIEIPGPETIVYKKEFETVELVREKIVERETIK